VCVFVCVCVYLGLSDNVSKSVASSPEYRRLLGKLVSSIARQLLLGLLAVRLNSSGHVMFSFSPIFHFLKSLNVFDFAYRGCRSLVGVVQDSM